MTDDNKTKHGQTRRELMETATFGIAAASFMLLPSGAIAAPIKVKLNNLNVGRDGVTIADPNLAKKLKTDPKSALKLLQQRHRGLKLSDVSVDSRGRVQIKNPAYARAIQNLKSKGGAAGLNIVCGSGC